jgi:hypothetical protein
VKLPGFTAEDSLYKTSEHYRIASAHAQTNGMIFPAQLERSRRVRNNQLFNKVCLMGTSCVPDPSNPSCRKCTYTDETCTEVLTWYECDLRPYCSPMASCNPDPLNPFCEICTVMDQACRKSTYQSCMGVKIPNKIPINVPDPVVGLTR